MLNTLRNGKGRLPVATDTHPFPGEQGIVSGQELVYLFKWREGSKGAPAGEDVRQGLNVEGSRDATVY